MNNDGFKLACKLFGMALIDIRESAHRSGDRVSFCLADLFHNLPASFFQNSQTDSEKVLIDLLDGASDRGYYKWLLNAADHLNIEHPAIEKFRMEQKTSTSNVTSKD